MKTTIVTTTVRVPTFLTAYHENAKYFGHEVDFVVAGDLKSDNLKTQEFCDTIPNCEFLSPAKQRFYIKDSPLETLPWNSPGRRNVALLWAYNHGADVIITLDDDNLATAADAVGEHTASIGNIFPRGMARSKQKGWFNVCGMLQERHNVEFYHRGYPPAQRWNDDFINLVYSGVTGQHAVVNAGLWTGDPDTDAITRLERPLISDGFRSKDLTKVVLAPGTWSPFNCQNTALAREIIPAYFLNPMIGRHDDIFASFIINRLAEHFGHVISFGTPLAFHDRSPHDLWKDLEAEQRGMQLTDGFVAALRDMKLTAKTYHEGFGQVMEGLGSWGWHHDMWAFMKHMQNWYEVFK
jgi:hypothetical protein